MPTGTTAEYLYEEGKEMKKILVLVTAIAMFSLTMTGCMEEKEPAETTAPVETTTTAEETTTAETTTAETTTEQKEITVEEALATRADGPWAPAVTNKISEWKDGNVEIFSSVEEDGMLMEFYINMYGEKAYVIMNIANKVEICSATDGTTIYMIDNNTKTFSREAATEENDIMSDTGVRRKFELKDGTVPEMLSSGIEIIDGEKYIYEEYEGDPDVKEDGTVIKLKERYYFDAMGNLKGIAQIDETGDIMFVKFEVEFLDELDESKFDAPKGYREVTPDEMGLTMAMKLLALMSEYE